MTGNRNLNSAARAKKDKFYMQMNDIAEELHHYKLSAEQISKITDYVLEEQQNWHNRTLAPFYPFFFVGCLFLPIKRDYETKECAVYNGHSCRRTQGNFGALDTLNPSQEPLQFYALSAQGCRFPAAFSGLQSQRAGNSFLSGESVDCTFSYSKHECDGSYIFCFFHM